MGGAFVWAGLPEGIESAVRGRWKPDGDGPGGVLSGVKERVGVKLPNKPQEGLGRLPSILVAKSIVRIAPNPQIVSGLDVGDKVGIPLL